MTTVDGEFFVATEVEKSGVTFQLRYWPGGPAWNKVGAHLVLFALAATIAVAGCPGDCCGGGDQALPPTPGPAKRSAAAMQRPGPPWAQLGTVLGTVIDDAGHVVAGASVEIVELGLSTKTDPQGRYVFRGVPIQPLTIRASADGHHPGKPAIFKASGGVDLTIDIELVRVQTVTESVVVTGTGTEHLQVDAPVRTALLTTRELTKRKAATNLAESLTATVAGVRVESMCQNCATTGIRLNGLDSKYTQILEDGLPTVSSVSMVYALDQIPVEFVETIEVVKGGASALYGPGAVGGAINLIRREPHSNAFQFTTQDGWHNGRPAHSLGFTGQAGSLPGGFAADYYFRGLRNTSVDRDEDGFSDIPKRKALSGGATLFRRFLEGRARLTAGGSTLSDYRRGGDRFDLRPEETWITEMADTARSGGFLRWNHAASSSTYYSLSASLTHLERDTYYGAGFDPNAYGHTSNPLLATDVQLGHQAGRHMILTGQQFQRERVRDTIPAYRRHIDEVFRNTGAYVQDEIRLAESTILLVGARLDKSNTLDHWIASPRGNIRIGVGERWRLRFGVSTGFRAPAVFEEDLHVAAVGGEGFILENAPGLKEERSLTWTGSLDYIGRIRELPFQAGVSFFSTRLDDVHVLAETGVPDSQFRRLQRRNAPGAYLRGVELDLHWRLHRTASIRAGATFQLARYRQPEPEFGSLRYFHTPSRYGFVTLDFVPADNLFVYLDADFTGPMLVRHYAGYIPEDRVESTGGFVVWSARITRSWPLGSDAGDKRELRLSVGIENLFDSYQPDLDRGPQRDSSYVYGPRLMRTAQIGMTLRF
jgi:outer membrane receptor for ferrienterochelin and colicins